jgi:hypothetical protein
LLLSDRQLGEDAVAEDVGMRSVERVVDRISVVLRHAAKAAAVDIPAQRDYFLDRQRGAKQAALRYI